VKFTTAPTLASGIIKGATTTDAAAGGFNLATYGANGVAALGTYASLSTTGGNANTDNVLVTTSTGPIISDTVHAVLIRGDGITISGTAGAALTVASGMVASGGGTTTGDTLSVPTLALGTQEGVFVTASGTTTVGSAITGSGGLTVGGAGNLVLSG